MHLMHIPRGFILCILGSVGKHPGLHKSESQDAGSLFYSTWTNEVHWRNVTFCDGTKKEKKKKLKTLSKHNLQKSRAKASTTSQHEVRNYNQSHMEHRLPRDGPSPPTGLLSAKSESKQEEYKNTHQSMYSWRISRTQGFHPLWFGHLYYAVPNGANKLNCALLCIVRVPKDIRLTPDYWTFQRTTGKDDEWLIALTRRAMAWASITHLCNWHY